MKVLPYSLFCLALFVYSGCTTSNVTEQDSAAEKEIENLPREEWSLDKAYYFALSDAGFIGETIYRDAFRAALNLSDSKEYFLGLLKSEYPAAQAYGIYGLYKVDRERYEIEKAAYINNEGTFASMSGCNYWDQPFNEFIASLDTGKLPEPFYINPIE